jgi:hypothetical protein
MLNRGNHKKTLDNEHEESLRCDCGSLVARLIATGVELKCRRCKRYVIIPLEFGVRKKIEIIL